MPRRSELELGFIGLGFLRSWLVNEQAAEHLRRQAQLAAGRDPNDDRLDMTAYDVSDGYTAWAETYDTAGNPIIALEEPVILELLAGIPPGRALDAACGTGRQTALLKTLGHDVLGVDSSLAMLEAARREVPGVEFREAGLTALPFEDGTFDLVVCSLALSHFDDLAPPVAELARATRPGGRLVLSDIHPVAIALGGQAQFRTPDGGRGWIRNYVHWHGDYLTAFRDAGLSVEDCRDVPYREQEVLQARADLLTAEVAAAALAGLPAVLIWMLAG